MELVSRIVRHRNPDTLEDVYSQAMADKIINKYPAFTTRLEYV